MISASRAREADLDKASFAEAVKETPHYRRTHTHSRADMAPSTVERSERSARSPALAGEAGALSASDDADRSPTRRALRHSRSFASAFLSEDGRRTRAMLP